jgi:dienelactone hydrolase
MSCTRRTLLTAGPALAAGTLIAAGIGTAAVATPPAAPPLLLPRNPPALTLPRPTGRYPVGTRTLHLVDRSRTDPLAPTPRQRELMVRLWYPAATRRGARAPYLTPGVSAILTADLNTLTGNAFPPDLLTFPTNSRLHAPVARTRAPLVLFSPGRGTNAAQYTALLEQFASAGYLVAGIDPTFEAPVEFPGGRVEIPPREGVPSDVLLPIRAADMRFVLDKLIARFRPAAVAAVGHSLGGRATVSAIDQDARIDAGADLDGSPLGGASLDRPFLLMGTGRQRRAGNPDWAAFYDRLRGPRLHLVVEGTEHFDFGDITVFKSTLDLGRIFEVGPIDGARALHIERTYLVAWLDFALRGRPSRLLRRESPDFPEVDFEAAAA